jgi:signal transduction histidine kinase
MTDRKPAAPLLSWDVLRRAGAMTLATASITMALTTATLAGRPGVRVDPSPWVLAGVVILVLAGLAVCWARPGNPIGWLLLGSAALQAVSLIGAGYAQAGYAAAGAPWPGAFVAAWLGGWTWFPSLTLPVAVLPAIYPSGRPASPGWRRMAWAGVLGTVGVSLALALGTGLDDIVPGLRLPWPQPTWPDVIFVGGGFGLLAVAVIGGLLGLVRRTLRAHAPERQLLAWLLVAVLPIPVLFFLPVSGGLEVGYALLGVAVTVAVLRYRLLGITVVLQRTLLYLPLTLLLAVVIAGVSTLIARVAPGRPVPMLAAAAVVAVLVGPVTTVIRRGVNRFVLGECADPLAAMNEVTSPARTSTDDPVGSLLAALAETVHAAHVAVLDADGTTVAEVGAPRAAAERFPLYRDGEADGELVITALHSDTDRRIVTALLAHVRAVVRAVQLTDELQTERDRALTATAAERDRIRRDLHDGLGPSLSGIALGLQAAARAFDHDMNTVRAIVDRTRVEADAAVSEVRRALQALGPSALDGHTLDTAVRSLARTVGLADSGTSFTLTCDDLTGVSPGVQEAAFRITSEALTNVVKHAHATHCDVALHRHDGHLEVDVVDDGCGMAEHPTAGVGVESMRRRAAQAGGALSITPPATGGPGTFVRAQLQTGGPR